MGELRAGAVNAVRLLWPWPVTDPQHPSGGNVYDARVRDGLRGSGWSCCEHVIAGAWPQPGRGAVVALEHALQACADGALVVIDGVMAPAGADAIAHAAGRLRVVILLHMPFGEAFPELAGAERVALAASATVVATSAWTRAWVRDRYGLPDPRIRVVAPGVDPAPRASTSVTGERLLCVANVSHLKGYDLLVAALGSIRDLAWGCTCVGAAPSDDAFLETLHASARKGGIEGRLRWTGALSGAALAAAWANADVLVLASRRESYGMVVVEALARGLPVIAAHVGGIAEALGRTAGGAVPGMLVAPDSPVALSGALRAWLQDPALRARMRNAAVDRRRQLRGWSDTVARFDGILREVQHGRGQMA